MKAITYIYGLIDPRDGLIHYVGRTVQDVERRLITHLSESKWDGALSIGTSKSVWLKELTNAGFSPQIVILGQEEIERGLRGLSELELFWIEKLQAEDHPLKNGWGTSGYGDYIRAKNAQRRSQYPLPPPVSGMTGNEIRIRRERLGLSQYQLAKALGYSNSTVSRWECGSRTPPPGMALLFNRIEESQK